jgi:predicted metal-binding protein
MMSPTIIFVCTTCRQGDEPYEPAEGRSGFKFHAALETAASKAESKNECFIVQAVECLGACDKSCNVTFAAKNKWSYGFSYLDPATQVQDVIDVAKLHFETVDGVIPWFERPDAIRRKSLSRTPPVAW